MFAIFSNKLHIELHVGIRTNRKLMNLNPLTLELNPHPPGHKLHFEEKKTESIYHV